MESNNSILKELNDWGSPLAGMLRKNPYHTPSGYFESLSESIHGSVKEYKQLEAMPKTSLFEVPLGYFDQLAGEILSKVSEEQFVNNLPKDAPFTVPAGYFETLPYDIAQVTTKSSETPVKKSVKTLPLGRQIWLQVRWAAAAILVLGISIGSLKSYLLPSNPEKAIARLPQGSIDSYVQQNIDEFSTDMIMSSFPAGKSNTLLKSSGLPLKDEEITQYLDNSSDQPELE